MVVLIMYLQSLEAGNSAPSAGSLSVLQDMCDADESAMEACVVPHCKITLCRLRLLNTIQHHGAYPLGFGLYAVRLSIVALKLPLLLLCHHTFLFDWAE